MLKTCPVDQTVGELLTSIQEKVDLMPAKSKHTLSLWVEGLNKRLEVILRDRLEEAIATWTTMIDSESSDLALESEYSIILRNQQLCISPPLEHLRAALLGNFHQHVGVFCNQLRLQVHISVALSFSSHCRFSAEPPSTRHDSRSARRQVF